MYVTSEARLARFRFDVLSWTCSQYGTEIVVVNWRKGITPHEELVQDLIAIITSFSGKIDRSRNHKTKKLLKPAKEAKKR